MITLILLTFIDLFVFIFNVLLITRIIMSYFASPASRIYAHLINLTEPILLPVRRLLPNMAGLDLAPLVTFFLLQGLQALVHAMLGA